MSVKAYTTALKYGDTADYGTAATWTGLARVKKIKPPVMKAKEIDTTALDSADEFDESIAGLANGGEVDMDIQYSPTVQATVIGFFRVVKSWRIVYPDLSGWQFNGYIIELGDEEIVNGEIIMSNAKIKITGKPVRAGAAALS